MVKSGIDIVLEQAPSWKPTRLGLVTNDAAITGDGTPSRKALLDSGFNLVKIFSPEHGLSAAGADGVPMQDQADPLTGLPVVSLYGNKLAPAPEDISDLDILLFDIPDAGVRFYTYLWTLSYCLEICASTQKPMIVLDRPNPISGILSLAGGPFLDESTCGSFIGRWSIPIRHSCTLGELALYFNQEKKIGCNLTVLACKGWTRSQFYPDNGMSFVAPSPALRSFNSLLLYPGTCLLEATNLHEGRGTLQAFSLVAAPWLDTSLLRDQLLSLGVEGLDFSMTQFVSTSSRFSNQLCNALNFSVRDPLRFDPLLFGFLLIKCIKDLSPFFEWGVYPTAVNPNGQDHLNRLLGVPQSQRWFDLPIDEFKKRIIDQCATATQWEEKIYPVLLYS